MESVDLEFRKNVEEKDIIFLRNSSFSTVINGAEIYSFNNQLTAFNYFCIENEIQNHKFSVAIHSVESLLYFLLEDNSLKSFCLSQGVFINEWALRFSTNFFATT